MMTHRRSCHLVPAAILATAAIVAAADVPGSQDHPLIKRYDGATIVRYSRNEFTEYRLPVGPVQGKGNDAKFPKAIDLEGRVTRITYLVPAGRSTLEVMRNYQGDLANAGFKPLFTGAHEALGEGAYDNAFATRYRDIALPSYSGLDFPMLVGRDDRFLAAKLSRADGDVHVALYVIAIAEGWGKFLYTDATAKKEFAKDGQVVVQLDVIEAKPMETKMVTVSAGEMARSITTTGSVALYGIFFDSNSAQVKQESEPALQEIGKLLKAQPALNLLVVGHTDNVGTFDFNMDLSRRRAEAVVAALVSRFGVQQRRLTPVGVSFASPVASNASEEGRARNRRVQLVENAPAAAGKR